MDSPTLWRSRPIFITSTFRDMHAERDWLRVHVFPVLEERLRERFHHLETVDLRWGVDSVSAQQEEAREHLVLTVCFNEIHRSRPFLIGLLGDRYGWTPPPAQVGVAAQEAGLTGDIAGKSVTELEIIHGVLGSVDQHRRSWFYLRESLPYDAMPRDVAARYSDAYSDEPGSADNVRNLTALKTRLTRELPARVRPYATRWNPVTNAVEGLEAWGAQVLEDVWSDLEAETAAFLREAPTTWQAQDRWALDEFIEGRVRDFVGRAGITGELLGFVTGEAAEGAPWGACVTAEAGGGKSSLFGHLCRALRDTGTLVLAHAAGISVRSTQVDLMLRRWVGELAEVLGEADPLDDRSPPDDIDAAFSRLLHRASGTQRVIVLIDALNQFEPTTRATHLTWVPRFWPPNARLVATAIPGAQSGALLQRAGVVEKPLVVIGKGEAAGIVRSICARYHRQLNTDVVDALLAKSREGGGPAYGNPLWLALATEQLNMLDSAAFERVDARAGAAGIMELLHGQVDAMPGEIAGLYEWLLRDAERHVGESWTRAFVHAIAVSRAGWRESDFRVLLPRLSGEPWDELRFAAVRRAFRAHVVQRGANAQWDFAHAQLRAAVELRMAATSVSTAALHDVIAEYLRSALRRDDPLHEAETMYHLMRSTSATGAAEYYGGDRTAGEVTGATRILTRMVLGGQVADVVARFDAAIPNESQARIASHILFELHDALKRTASLESRLQMLQTAASKLATLVVADPANIFLQRELRVSYDSVGDVRQEQGNLRGAQEAYEAAMEISARLAADPGWAVLQRDLGISYERVGSLRVAQGDLPGALAASEAAWEIRSRLASADPQNTMGQHDLAASHISIGDLRRDLGNLSGALAAYEAALTIAMGLTTGDPGNAEWQRDLSVCQKKMGNVRRAQGNLPGAVAAYEAALTITTRLAAADPGDTRWQDDLWNCHVRMGDVRRKQENLPAALAEYEAALSIGARLARADPWNARWQSDLSLSHDSLGDVLSDQGNVPAASAAYETALAIRMRLAAADPRNAEWQHDLSISHVKIGNIRTGQGNLPGALAAYEAALAIRERLAAANPRNAIWQKDLSVSHGKVGDVHRAQGNLAEALAEYEAELAIATRTAGADPTNAGWQRDLAANHTRIGDVLSDQGNLSGALVAYEAALAIRERLAAADSENAQWQYDLWICYYVLAAACERSGDARAHGWWRRAYDQLATTKRAGALRPADERFLAYLRKKRGT